MGITMITRISSLFSQKTFASFLLIMYFLKHKRTEPHESIRYKGQISSEALSVHQVSAV